MRAAEVSSLLHSLLGDQVVEKSVSSHSLKATCLSWAGKYGVPPECQNILGRHSDSVRGSAPLYNRDLCAAPVRQLQQIILAIYQAKFCPDSSRSMYFPGKTLPSPIIVVKDEQPDEVGGESAPSELSDGPMSEPVLDCSEGGQKATDASSESQSSSPSSSSGESSTSGSESEDFDVPQKRVARAPWPRECLWMHSKSRIIHAAKTHTGGGTAIFACGRVVTRHHVRVDAIGSGRRCEACVRLFLSSPGMPADANALSDCTM